MTTKKRLPLDFEWWALLPVYIILLAIVFPFGLSVGSRWLWMIGSFIIGFLAGLPAAKWELTAIGESWDEILHGPLASFRMPYFRNSGARKRTVYFLILSILLPVIYLMISYNFYWYRYLSETPFRQATYLLFRWNGWYWFPYIIGLSFSSAGLPRLIAGASYKHHKIPYPRGVKNENETDEI